MSLTGMGLTSCDRPSQVMPRFVRVYISMTHTIRAEAARGMRVLTCVTETDPLVKLPAAAASKFKHSINRIASAIARIRCVL